MFLLLFGGNGTGNSPVSSCEGRLAAAWVVWDIGARTAFLTRRTTDSMAPRFSVPSFTLLERGDDQPTNYVRAR